MNEQTEKLRKGIAKEFEIARQEGVLRRFADGFADADQMLQACKESGLVFISGSLGASHPHLANYYSVEEIDIE